MADGIKVTWSVEKALARLERSQNLSGVQREVSSTFLRIVNIYKRRTPVSKDEEDPERGNLAAGWSSKVVLQGAKVVAQLKNSDPRARDLLPMLAKGTKKHDIVPRSGVAALRFQMEGKFVFARSVKHPGAKKSQSLEEANEEVKSELNNLRGRIARILIGNK